MFLAGYEPPYSSISVEYGPQRHISFRASGDCPKASRRLVARHFDKAGRLTSDGFARFDRFVTAAKEIDPELRIYDDVFSFVTEVRDAARRADAIAETFPAGVRRDEMARVASSSSLRSEPRRTSHFSHLASDRKIVSITRSSSFPTSSARKRSIR